MTDTPPPVEDGQAAPALGEGTDATLGDETRELLLRGDVKAALGRHDPAAHPAEEPERTTGDLGGAGGDQEGGAG